MDDEAIVAAISMLAMARLCELWSHISHSQEDPTYPGSQSMFEIIVHIHSFLLRPIPVDDGATHVSENVRAIYINWELKVETKGYC
jgi:hypothetical protein